MSMIELLSFILIFNFFQFIITNIFSELFWSAQKFNRTNQNLFVNNLIFLFTEIVSKILVVNVFKKTFVSFFFFKKK